MRSVVSVPTVRPSVRQFSLCILNQLNQLTFDLCVYGLLLQLTGTVSHGQRLMQNEKSCVIYEYLLRLPAGGLVAEWLACWT